MWEETLGFFVLLVPLALALGYDRMVAASIIFLGAGSGVIALHGQPVRDRRRVRCGRASASATGSACGSRCGSCSSAMAIGYVLRYARRVAATRRASVVGISTSDAAERAEPVTDVPALTGRQKLVLVLFAGAFLVMIYGFIPWNDLWQEGLGNDFPLPTFAAFYFPEAAALFFVMAVVIGLIAKLGEEGTVNTIVAGASDFLGAALIIVLARGITVVMKNAYMTDTVLHWMENAVSGTSQRRVRRHRVHREHPDRVPRAVLVGARGARHADPGAAGRLRRRARSVAVTAYQSASGLVNLVTPTSAVIMGGLALSKVGYDRYLKFVWPFVARRLRRRAACSSAVAAALS